MRKLRTVLALAMILIAIGYLAPQCGWLEELPDHCTYTEGWRESCE